MAVSLTIRTQNYDHYLILEIVVNDMIQDSVTAAAFLQILTVDSFVANDFSDLHSPYAPAQSAPTAHSARNINCTETCILLFLRKALTSNFSHNQYPWQHVYTHRLSQCDHSV